MPSSAAAALADLFSKARLSLNVPASSSSGSRSVVFFDEVLNVEAILTLPSDPLLPIASTSTQASSQSYALPLPALPEATSLGHESISPYLTALLACLHVNLLTDYVPNDSSPAALTTKSTSPYEPLSTVQPQFQHLQLLPSHNPHLDPAQTQYAAVRAFSNAWAGNQPPKPHRTLKDSANPDASISSKSSHNAHIEHDGQRWSVHWHCRVPINYIATPFLPFLSITAALTLRLDNTLLNHLIPASSSRSFMRSGFAHSLLAPLHEGPVYPDESPLQSQARANASSALGLDGPHGLGSYLAHLPKDVVGGNTTIVTPRSGASALEAIHKRRNDAISIDTAFNKSHHKPDTNGDLAVLSTSASHSHTAQSTAESDSGQHASALRIYKRSTRQLLSLKTGLNVRMRTLATKHDPYVHRRSSSHQPLAELDSTRLVLSVELENPFESDAAFTVNDIQIKIGSTQADQQEPSTVVAKPLQPMASVLPIQLTRGSQHNMLFYVSVEADHALHASRAEIDQRVAGARNVTITVSGRPHGEQEQLADFDSQWNCALDLTSVLSDAAMKSLIASSTSTSGLDQPIAGPVAGNSQYSASSLRAAAHSHNRLSYHLGAPPRAESADDTRTPRPGQLGRGFLPPLRTSSARHFSIATAASTIQHLPTESQPTSQIPPSFLQKARARAARHQSNPQLEAYEQAAALNIRPWMSRSTVPREVTEGGLVVLSTLRRAGTNTVGLRGTVESNIKFESSLGDDGVARPSVSTGAKTLHPASIPASNLDERATRFQIGDTVVVDLTLLHKPGVAGIAQDEDAMTDITLSWAPSSNKSLMSKTANRDSIDASADVSRARLIDADSARLKSSLLFSRAETLNGLIPVQDHLHLQAALLPAQSRNITLALRCLSPGYHTIPSLKFEFHTTTGGPRQVLLDGLGRVYVTPAAVL